MMNQKCSDYESEQIKAIVEWKQKAPSVVAQGLGKLAAPLTWVTKKVLPESAMKAVLNSANSAGELLADESDICRDGNVRDISELRHKDLRLSDQLADNVHNWAIGAAAVEGGVAGAVGILGIAADIPAILTLALRTIHKIGLCYGYRANNKQEKDFVLEILSAAGSNSQAEKNEALVTLKMLQVVIEKQTWKAMEQKAAQALGKEAAVIAIKNLCKQLGINFTKRKALQAIPIVGGGIAAAVNADFIRDVGYASIRIYQQRWLRDNEKWVDSI
ncbi:MAG: EcsC family protein [Selenomonadaceae bacterium]|nr:EcsC family protein [Selenomonadaceae bacterium]